jgi:tRNA A37 threonylcarbamoyladenosine synthetase subunit TsaC/SUA5/YrdC
VDQRNSSSRLPRLSVDVILTQTDTTVGFLSQDAKKLYEIKSRQSSKPFLKVYQNFKTLLKENNRIPKNMKNFVRRSKKTTFIVKNRAFRVANPTQYSQVLREFSWSYSTSANESGKHFDRVFCEAKADIIIEDARGLYESSSSSLIKINNTTKKRLR